MRKFLLIACVGVFALANMGDAQAQSEKRYKGWKPPAPLGTSSSGIKDPQFAQFVKELQRLLVIAKRDRAANPRFIRDIQQLIAKYKSADDPWGNVLFQDRFEDGDYTRNPAWKVVQGKFWVERELGLRSRVKSKRFSRQMSEEEQAQLLVQAILGAATGDKRMRPDPGDDEPAGIAVPRRIPNGFVAEIVFKSHQPGGHLEFGVYQASRTSAGYRVLYRPGRPLRLAKVSAKGIKVIGRSQGRVNLEDGRDHKLSIARLRDGRMAVSLDENRIININDNSFRDRFDGALIVNRAGDFSVSHVIAVAAR